MKRRLSEPVKFLCAFCFAAWVATSLAFAQTPLSLGLQFSAGHPTLTITGTVGTVYSIQCASDLSPTNQWSELTQIQMQGVSTYWTDPRTPTSDQRFYRALTMPATGCPTHQYRFEEGAPDQPATGIGSVLDFVDHSGDGTPIGSPVYRADVGWTRVAACQCESNTLSLELTAGQSVKVNSPFIFHNQYGDATLEFLVKPAQQPHHSLFWTRPDNTDRNRFNIAINPNGGFGFDYRDPSGVLHLKPANQSLFQIPLNTWTHIAIVRDTQSAAPAHIYDVYVDGFYAATQVDPNPNLPTSDQAWQISGRSGFYFIGSVDEIRFTARKLDPSEFLISETICGP